jgi:hypothetical protein
MHPLSILLAVGSTSIVQSPEPAHAFDFWLGKWECAGKSYDAAGKASDTKARNNITMDFDGHVVHEHFTMPPMRGESFSVYDPAAKLWRQTWVDNQAGYIVLAGSFADGVMTLNTIHKQGTTKFNRMVFRNITPRAFDWDWDATDDGGQTWQPSWHLHYTRKG